MNDRIKKLSLFRRRGNRNESGEMAGFVMMMLFIVVLGVATSLVLERTLFRQGHIVITTSEGKLKLVNKQVSGYREDTKEDVSILIKFRRWFFNEKTPKEP